MRHLENLFKAKPKPRKGFVPLMACMDTFLKYDLPEYIPDQCYCVSTVLVFEAVMKIIMDFSSIGVGGTSAFFKLDFSDWISQT